LRRCSGNPFAQFARPAIVVLMLAGSAAAQPGDTSLGEIVELPRLTHPFPANAGSVDHAVSSDGLLFLAGKDQVVVWTPWGWQTVWTFERSSDVHGIKAIAFARGRSGERLLIATTQGLAAARWEYNKSPGSEWGKAEQVFTVEAIESWKPEAMIEGIAVNSNAPAQDGAAIGYLFDERQRLFAVRDTGSLQIDAVPASSTGNQVVFAPSGHAVAWPYRGRVVTILSPTGGVSSKIDLERIMARDPVERRNLSVDCAYVDEKRGLWFVGTSHGLAVGGVEAGSRRPLPLLRRVERPGTISPLAIGDFLGRLLVAVSFDGKGGDGAIFLENSFGVGADQPARFAALATFSVTERTPEMGRPSRAAIVGPDIVWAVATGGIWEWSLAGWHHVGADFEPPRQHETKIRPMVLTDILRKRFWCLRPRATDGFRETSRASGPLTAQLSDACPDPSGGGLWVWDQKASRPDMGYVRFASPHAMIDNRSGTSHPARFQVARLGHREAGGTVHTPLARNGALLLPTGADFLLGRAGHWLETDKAALAGGDFIELTPAALSAQAAWLGIRRDGKGPRQVVTIDIAEPARPDAAPKIEVDELGLTAPAEAEVGLVPDSTGSVWFAVKERNGWRLRRINPGLPDRGPVLFAPGLSEAPRYLFLSNVAGWLGDGFLLTDTGGCPVARANQIGAGNEPLLLPPEVKTWVPLWPERPPARGIQADYEAVLSSRAGLAGGELRVILFRRASDAGDTELFFVTQNSQAPVLSVERIGQNLGSGRVRGFQPRLWFPGSNEYVVGEMSEAEAASSLLVLPVNGVSSIPSGSWLKIFANGFLPKLGARLSGVALNRPGGQDASVLAVAGGNRVAFEEVSALSNSVVFVPTAIEVHQGGSEPQVYDVRRGLPPDPLPASVDHVTVRVSPNYGDWWRAEWSRASLRDAASATPAESFPLVEAAPAAMFHVPMSPGLRRELVIATDAWPDPVAAELPHLPIRQASPPPGPSLWWSLALLPLILAAVAGGIGMSAEFYHRLLSRLGFQWQFSDADAQASVFILDTGDGRATLRRAGESISLPVSVPPVRSEFDPIRREWRAWADLNKSQPFHVWVIVDRNLFREDWNSCFSDALTDPEGRIVAGRIYGFKPGERLALPPLRTGPLVVSALGCEIRAGDRMIPMLDLLISNTADAFRVHGFRVETKERNANRSDLEKALKESDIVIVAGHAQDGAFRFSDEDFGAAEWRALGEAIRCRFMLIVGCGLGELVKSADPLLLEVVSRGVTCVASTRERQDTIIANDFLPALCREWRAGRQGGPTIGHAMRRAVAAVPVPADESTLAARNDDLNAYVIIGTPTLRVEWRWAGKRLWR
jgi:hypothetical protein